MKREIRQYEEKEHPLFAMYKVGILLCIGILMVGNVIIFAKSVQLSDHIASFEEDTKKLKDENSELKRTLYEQNSLKNLEEFADQLGFTKEAEPIYLETSDYALLR